MATVISRVTTAETAALECMVQLYLHDFSEFGPFELNAEGLFSYPDLDKFWMEPRCYAFLARCDNRLAGFALVQRGFDHVKLARRDEQLIDMVDFFVLRRYRRREVSRTMAETCFRAARGLWQVRTDDFIPCQFLG